MLARIGKTVCIRPRLVVGYSDSVQAALLGRHCRRLGWQVNQAGTGPEIRQLARVLHPSAVVIDTQLPGESGWLTAAKLLLERPGQKVFLVGPQRTPRDEQFAAFLGAAFLEWSEAPAFLAEQLGESLAPAYA